MVQFRMYITIKTIQRRPQGWAGATTVGRTQIICQPIQFTALCFDLLQLGTIVFLLNSPVCQKKQKTVDREETYHKQEEQRSLAAAAASFVFRPCLYLCV